MGRRPHIPHAVCLLESPASKHGQFKWAVFWWETARFFWVDPLRLDSARPRSGKNGKIEEDEDEDEDEDDIPLKAGVLSAYERRFVSF